MESIQEEAILYCTSSLTHTHLYCAVGEQEVIGVGGVELEEGCQVAEGLSQAALPHAREQLLVHRQDALHVGENGVNGLRRKEATQSNGLQK